MSSNNYQPHILVLPEDDANRQIAIGFLLEPNINNRAIQVLPPAHGWKKVVDNFREIYVPQMRKYKYRRIVLLIDFDHRADRLRLVTDEIPEELKNRVFVLGVLSEPEELKRKINKTFEKIGQSLAEDCPDNKNELWQDTLLKHNDSELDRFMLSVKAFLFGA